MDSFRFNFAEKPEYWVRLARLYEQINQLERALACHEQLARRQAMSLDDTIRQAQLLWRLQRPDARAGVLLDGFPRTMEQAIALSGMLQTLNRQIDGFIDKDEFKKQIDEWIRVFRSTKPAPGSSGPLIPGDPEPSWLGSTLRRLRNLAHL